MEVWVGDCVGLLSVIVMLLPVHVLLPQHIDVVDGVEAHVEVNAAFHVLAGDDPICDRCMITR